MKIQVLCSESSIITFCSVTILSSAFSVSTVLCIMCSSLVLQLDVLSKELECKQQLTDKASHGTDVGVQVKSAWLAGLEHQQTATGLHWWYSTWLILSCHSCSEVLRDVSKQMVEPDSTVVAMVAEALTTSEQATVSSTEAAEATCALTDWGSGQNHGTAAGPEAQPAEVK